MGSEEIGRLVLGAAPGPVLHLLTLGATIQRLEVTGGDGGRRNVALGHPSAQDYLDGPDYLGAVVGRYANRIADGRFRLDGREVRLGLNDRGHTLHGGPDGFSRRVWTVEDLGPFHARLGLVSPDGDQGFPGTVRVTAEYTVDDDSVRLVLTGTSDAPTVLNLTSHVYLNLDGEGSGTIDGHLLQVEADEYTPVDATGIPLGPHAPLAGTPFDLREPTLLGPRTRTDHEQLRRAQGLDHNYVLRPPPQSGRNTLTTTGESVSSPSTLRRVATVVSPRTNTAVDLHTDRPGLQVYTGNFLDGSRPSTAGGLHRQGDGLALEPQFFPDSPNHPEWPSPRLDPGETSRAEILWRFRTL